MKTKNNVQKTILRFAAVVVSFVLISFTVSAHDFWKRLITGSSFNEIALAMVDHSKKVDHTSNSADESFYFDLYQEKDVPMSLEPWMTDKSSFGESAPVIENETDFQSQDDLRMLNEKLSKVQEVEEGLKLESWMISKDAWK